MKSIRLQRFASITASLFLIGASVGAVAQASASDDDKKFVEDALKGGMGEVDLGQLAAKKGASDDVKQFGQTMVTDHTKLGDKMKAVAGDVGVKPPSMSDASAIALKTELEVLSGDAFDKAYIRAMVKDHEADLKDFKKEIAEGQSTEVKTAARHGEAVIAKHLAMIRKIAAAHNVTVASN
jgi:putative membrane protein